MANTPVAYYDWGVIQKLRSSGLSWAETANELGIKTGTLKSASSRRQQYLATLTAKEVDMRATLAGVALDMMLEAKTRKPNPDHEYTLKWADFLAKLTGAYAPTGPSAQVNNLTQVNAPGAIYIVSEADGAAPPGVDGTAKRPAIPAGREPVTIETSMATAEEGDVGSDGDDDGHYYDGR